MYALVDSDVSINNYFDPKAIYCLISLFNITNNREAIPSANSPELRVSRGNAGYESVILPLGIRDYKESQGD